MTLSGGESLFQPEFTLAVLAEAREAGLHTAMETSLYAPVGIVHKACELLSYLILDIKLMDNDAHQYWTGVRNDLILENYGYIREVFPDLPVKVRTPLIPGVNDNREELQKIVDFLKVRKPDEYELLPYHPLGENKYRYLGKNYEMGELKLEKDKEEEMKEFARAELAY